MARLVQTPREEERAGRDELVSVAIPRELVGDLEAWLCRFGRELLPLPSGEFVAGRVRGLDSARTYDGCRDGSQRAS